MRVRSFALALLLVASAAGARIISYSPYSDRISYPATQHRMNRFFAIVEVVPVSQVGLSPVFYGQALAGRDLPHLSYMTSGPDMASHLEHWKAFGNHPTWVKLRNDPQYADTVTKITKRFLVPTGYSQI